MKNCVRLNPATGELDYYFPLEITDESTLRLARLQGLEIGIARLGFRKFKAVFVPCRKTATDDHGNEIFVDTPSEIQRERYLQMIRDELSEQDAIKQDARCNISDGHGGLRRCPARVRNPNYVPGGDEPATLPVSCDGCKYEPYKMPHQVVELSTMDHDDSTYEIPAPANYYAGDDYERMAAAFVQFVKENAPQLASQATLHVQEYTRSEAARELNIPGNTAANHKNKLKALCAQFLDNFIDFHQ